MRAWLTIRSCLEAYAGCGRDSKGHLLITLTPPPKKDGAGEDGWDQAVIPLPTWVGLGFPSPRPWGLGLGLAALEGKKQDPRAQPQQSLWFGDPRLAQVLAQELLHHIQGWRTSLLPSAHQETS